MKTPSGGSVSIYESKNPNQKNNRFRVDTGTHYNDFNTLEEAKAFAEKEYGGNNSVKIIDTSAARQKLDELTKNNASFKERRKIAEQIKSADVYNFLIKFFEVRKEKPTEEMQKQLAKLKSKAEGSAPRQLTGDCKITIKG